MTPMNRPMNRPMTRHEAWSALNTARSATTAARGPRPMAGWLPATAGALFAAEFVAVALLAAHPGGRAYYVPAVVVLPILGLVAVFAAARSGGLVLLPSGSLATRWARQAHDLAAFVPGGIAAVFWGLPGFIGVTGVGLGVSLWWRLEGGRRGAGSESGSGSGSGSGSDS